MTDEFPLLDRKNIEEAFRQLGNRLAARGVVADIYVFGGAAMALAYDSRRATRDIDAIFHPHGIVAEQARAVAADLGLPAWWLNEQASVYVAPQDDTSATRIFNHEGLRVSTASPQHLLAMKMLASRHKDLEDIQTLVHLLGLTTPDEVLVLCAKIFPDEEPPPRARLLLEDLFASNDS